MKNMVIYAAFLFLGEIFMQEFDMNELNKKFLKNGVRDMSLKEMRFFLDNYSKKDSQEKGKDDLGLSECENLSENKMEWTLKNDQLTQKSENEKFSFDEKHCLLNNQKSIISSQNNRQIQSNFNRHGRTYGD